VNDLALLACGFPFFACSCAAASVPPGARVRGRRIARRGGWGGRRDRSGRCCSRRAGGWRRLQVRLAVQRTTTGARSTRASRGCAATRRPGGHGLPRLGERVRRGRELQRKLHGLPCRVDQPPQARCAARPQLTATKRRRATAARSPARPTSRSPRTRRARTMATRAPPTCATARRHRLSTRGRQTPGHVSWRRGRVRRGRDVLRHLVDLSRRTLFAPAPSCAALRRRSATRPSSAAVAAPSAPRTLRRRTAPRATTQCLDRRRRLHGRRLCGRRSLRRRDVYGGRPMPRRGSCNSTTGTCSNPAAPNGTACNDGNPNTVKRRLPAQARCAGVDLCAGVTCSASDQCHLAGSCDHANGLCSKPVGSGRHGLQRRQRRHGAGRVQRGLLCGAWTCVRA
jgi:hypothetical protein